MPATVKDPEPPADNILAEHDRRVREYERELLGEAAAAEPDDGAYFGRSPEKQEEKDYNEDRVGERILDSQNSSTDRRLSLLEEQLAEANATILKMQRDRGAINIDDAACQAEHDLELKRWRNYCKLVEDRGGIAQIVINASEDPALNRAVPVCVNGRWYQLPRGKPIRVTVDVLEVLANAFQCTLQPLVDDQGDVHKQIVKKWSYPFMVMDPPAERVLTQ